MIRTTAIVLGMLCLAVPASSSAQQVGLAPFSGPRHRVVRRVVRSALESRVSVVDVESDAADGVDAVVTGSTTGSRSRPRLTLVLLDREGSERARETLRVAQNRRGERAIARAVASLLDAAGDLSPPVEEPDEPEPAPLPVSEPVAVDPDPEPASSASDSTANPYPYLHLLVGLSMRNREFVARLAGASEVRNAMPLYPELLAEARIRPMAGSDDPLLAGIRARVRFGYALFFESATPSGQVIGGSAWSLEGDAGWLAPVDDGRLVELGVTLGGGYSSYGLDDNVFVPTVDYGSFEVRAVTRIRAIGEEFVIRAEAGYRYAIGSGAVAERYGSLDGHGALFEGGFEGLFVLDSAIALSWMAAVEWQNTWLSFSGAASDQLSTGGTDGFLRGRIGVGLAVR